MAKGEKEEGCEGTELVELPVPRVPQDGLSASAGSC